VYGRASRRTRRIAIFGSRGTGKTCFFASLYGHASSQTAVLSTDHDPTLTYMKKVWDAYESAHGFPEPTPSEVPQRLVFQLGQPSVQRDWVLEILDHAGEFIERTRKQGNTNLRDIVRTWLRDAEAVLIFLDVSREETEATLERRNEVGQLLSLVREAVERGAVRRPLGIVLTRWDCLGPIGDDPVQERQRAWEYLSRTPAFHQIYLTLKTFGSAVEVFPVSAIGTNRMPRRKPTRPYNLLAPISWAAHQTDVQRVAAAKRVAERPWTSLTRAIQKYEELITLDGIGNGPAYTQFAPRLEQLKKRRGRWRLGGITTAALVALAVAGGTWLSWGAYANRQYQAWSAFCENEGKGDVSAEQRLALAQGLLAWHGLVLGHEQKARLQECLLRDPEVVRDHGERRDWQEIEADRTRLETLDDPEQIEVLDSLVNRLEGFGAKWQGRKVGLDWKAGLESSRSNLASHQTQLERYNETVKKERVLATRNDSAGLFQLWDEYLKADPKPTPYYAGRAVRQLTKYGLADDTRRLDDLVTRASKPCYELKKCAGLLAEIEEFRINRKDKNTHGERIQSLIRQTLQAADGIVYEDARKAVERAQKSLKVEDLRAAGQEIDRYLNATDLPDVKGLQRPVLMRQAAAERYDWFEKALAGRKYTVKLRSLFVPKGHKLYNNSWWGNPGDSWAYSLTLSGALSYDAQQPGHKTPRADTQGGQKLNDREGVRIDLKSLPEPGEMTWTPGAYDLKIQVWRSGYRGWWPSASDVDKELYLPGVLKQGWEVKDETGVPLTVFIELEGADIPDLPPFTGK
jgi:hypothetical protein